MPMTEAGSDEIFLIFALVESGRALKALDEVARLAGLKEERQPGVEVRENQTVFDQIRLALQFASNVSKVFWPHNNAAQRGGRLRQLTGLPEQHGLSDRRLRNHIEHMDERLDEWTLPSPRPFLTYELVLHDDGRPPEMRQEVLDATAVVFEPNTNSIHLFGQSFQLDELRAAVEDVQVQISAGLMALHA